MRNTYEAVKQFVLDHMVDHVVRVNGAVAKHFGISTQAASQHLSRMVDEGLVVRSGPPRERIYQLVSTPVLTMSFDLGPGFAEDLAWRVIEPRLPTMSESASRILFYAATEMLNNANDHSEGKAVIVHVSANAAEVKVVFEDNGVGIFKKIAGACQLQDEHQAVLELTKGKLTTAPQAHSGEGIFFTSRASDVFSLSSGHIILYCNRGTDWLMDRADAIVGTRVAVEVRRNTTRALSDVFRKYAEDIDTGFSRTIVPLSLARYGHENLVSRSQAKRVLARIDRFHEVIFDFDNVDEIGQAFADEIFRVFANEHPEIQLTTIRARAAVKRMIAHVIAPARTPPTKK